MLSAHEETPQRIPLALAEELLRNTGELRFVARGASMLPAICPGDELVAQSIRPDRVHVGDVILFVQRGRWFAHRVVRSCTETAQPHLITQGDALLFCDAPVFAQDVLGRITFVVRNGALRKLSPACSVSHQLMRAAVRRLPFFAAASLRWHRACCPSPGLRRAPACTRAIQREAL